jgi:alkylated DNA repair dioxygenase AlkB
MPRKAKAKAKKRKRTEGIHISLQRNETVNNDIIVTNSNEPEIWDLKRQIRRKRECSCHTPGCTEQAIAIWVSNKTTTAGNEWLTCEECQITDFGGWPEGEVPVNNDNDNGSHTNDIMSLSRNNDTISSGKESSFTTPSPKQRQVPRVAVTPSPPLMKEKLQRNLATIRFCTMPQSIIEGKDRQDRQKQKWTDRQSLYSIPRRSIQPEEPCICKLRRGGTLKIYPNLVHHMETKRVKEDLFSCGLFRQYQIQGQNEPRLHFLLNDNATNDDFETSLQPGYSYANVKMKARPLKILPELEQLSQKLATVSGVDRWTIGVNPVLYRDCQDKMGSHADDDQGEQVILCLIVSSLQEARRVIITPNDKKSIPAHGDEIIELKLRPGDA